MRNTTQLFTLLLVGLLPAHLSAQATANATASSGAAYQVFYDAGFGVEGPDNSSPACAAQDASVPGNHKEFGPHILQAFDAELEQNVFAFYSHIDEDGDRCVELDPADDADRDRVRVEIKGGPAGDSDPELEHQYGDTSYYRWQFRLDEGFVGSSSFTHLFQSKAQGGTETGYPILTLTARSSVVDLIYGELDDSSLGVDLVSVSLEPFRGNWVEVYVKQVHTDNGELTFLVNDVATGASLLSYFDADIDLWREAPDAGTINRPKWGIYRKRAVSDPPLRDEVVRFANFCSSESSATVCPSLLPDVTGGGAPVAVTNPLPLDGSRDVPLTMPLTWDASLGATGYNVYLSTDENVAPTVVGFTVSTEFPVELAAGTTYFYQIGSVNDNGEAKTGVLAFSTLDQPDDGTWDVARGHARPEVENDADFDFDTNLGTPPGVDEVNPIANETGNNAYCYFSGPKEGSAGNYRWRYRQDSEDETTVVMRLAPLDGNTNIAYVEIYGLGWRQKLRIDRDGIKLEKTTDGATFDFPEGYWDDGAFHTLRITFANNPTAGAGAVTNVYLDEAEEIFATGLSNESTSSSARVDIGRAGSTDYGACFDFIAINPTGAFAPNDAAAPALPADLFPADAPPVAVFTTPLSIEQRGRGLRILTWGVSEQVDADYFTVESSTDSVTYAAIGTIAADGTLEGERLFTFRQNRPLRTTTYYRIRVTGLGGGRSSATS